MRRLAKVLWVLLALLFLLEAWLWSHLAPVVGAIVRLVAWQKLRARIAGWIEHLPPYATLLVFLIPILLLLPVKLIGLWFLARGWWLGAMATLVGAKIVSTGVTAFIFDVTRPKLLQLWWFRMVYDRVIIWIGWAHGLIDPLKARVREWATETLAPLKRRLRSLLWLLRPSRSGRFLRRILRIRRRVQQA
jgi:hypothetical protein